jgi:hypothetical protein
LFYGLIFNVLRIGVQIYFCQLLKNSSEELSAAIYDCGWENFEDEKCKNFVKFSLMRAQKSEAFKILDWMEINLELLGKVRNFFKHVIVKIIY